MLLTEGITKLLVRWSEGDQAALEKLTPYVYDELRRLAQSTYVVSAQTTRCKPRRSFMKLTYSFWICSTLNGKAEGSLSVWPRR